MIGYASRTGTRATLAALRGARWGLLVCASKRGSSEHRTEGFELTDAGVILDNAAAKVALATGGMDQRPTPELTELRAATWRAEYRAPFEALVAELGPNAQSIMAPDIVGGGAASLAMSSSWLPRLAGIARRVLVPVQDGMLPEHVKPLLGPDVGIFVGGSRGWKWDTLATLWAPLARAVGCWLHVGRAASNRMVGRCALAGADSFDTTQPTRYLSKLAGLDNARRQLAFSGCS